MSKDLIQALESIANAAMDLTVDRRVLSNAAREALSSHRSSVESVELPEGEAFALGTGLLWPGDAPPEGEDGCEALYTASTVRSLIAAAVERERERCHPFRGEM